MIERDGYPFIIGVSLVALVSLYTYWSFGFGWALYVGCFFVALALFITYFFRSPNRSVNMEPGMIVSPADGKVLYVKTYDSYPGFSGEVTVIATFLSVFDVHVNWIPISGAITKVEYITGKFKLAYVEKASTENERSEITVESSAGTVLFKQIAGTIARRIVYRVKQGDSVTAGDKYGLIRFGSRVEVFFDARGEVFVKAGDRVKGGETIIARLPVVAKNASEDATQAASTENV
ncbi:phosphatidylserine decarboxylase family protein [Gemmatimonas aurantiaca]|nr:phosphatidylserine decarboxylase family protein [Gemmatimonas aurantiaca]